jgi:hypothetical protein
MPRKQAKYGNPAVYNATPPTYNDGDPAALQVDAAGRLIIGSGSTTGTLGGAPTNGGTTAGSTFETAVSVQTTDTPLVGARAGRKLLIITNDSANIVYVTTQGTATVNAGIRLNANGGVLVLDRYVPQGALRAIALTGASNVTIVEGV